MTAGSKSTAESESKSTKKAFMLHNAGDMVPVGKYMSNTFRQAALKAASNGHSNVILRQTGTKICKQFTCQIKVLDKPKVIMRGNKEIKYANIPQAKWIRSFTMDAVDESEPQTEQLDA